MFAQDSRLHCLTSECAQSMWKPAPAFDRIYKAQPSSACWLLPNIRYSTNSGNGNGLLIR